MAKQILLYGGFAASLGVMTYPFTVLGDTVLMYHMRLGSMGPSMKKALTTFLNVFPASMVAYALPIGAGFGLPSGKTKLVIQSAMIPALAVIMGVTIGDTLEGWVANFEKTEKYIKRDAQCLIAALATFLSYLGLYATRAAHLTLFA